ncbi:MAG: neutral zinc metallopeptidase [Muribaculaceae bacterium]|uniref:Neutral zinc metallopeptidase n=1 Tax=Duncaniella dubosii TaxID=2518971 RepID=A0A4P7W0A0_9BACT|nr:neutral zinc metallopeptidase [Duncaniella dubosii]MBJ2190611.1 neutral zinc metallopeptidase [Muribaculaceae bacterium]MCX4283555.1 zinc metallopeptidase [Duncaniella dubosii]QCD41276.1 neutral zinc metallopeptidase [Duncaniella dubosii]HBN64596.1 neutral zinc metallopeptidase [Porphyromonadaceae bacterium]
MRLNGRRESSNVSDRRGSGGARGLKIGGGIGAVIIAVIIAWISGGNPLDVITSNVGNLTSSNHTTQNYTPTEEEEELAQFSRQILAGTEDVWTKLFASMGKEYEPPTLVLFTDAVQSACGNATSQVGPFYCSADQCLYIDLSFFRDMRKTLGADGDFAYAYVIAHEVGHHVQHLLGTLDQAHSQMNRVNETEANNISVRIELQADFLAGVWAHHDNAMFNSLEPGDIEEALDASMKIGDDYLQKRAQGYSVPDSFTHGTSEQRSRWLKRGLSTGDITKGDTFSIPYSSL